VKCFYLAGLLAVILSPSIAAGAAEVLRVSADFDHELFVDMSPSPVCWHYFDTVLEGSVNLELHEYHENEISPCAGGWLLHADSDSLAYHGWWEEDDPENYVWNWQRHGVDLELRIAFAQAVTLRAERFSAGQLSTDEQLTSVAYSTEDPVILLGAGTGDVAEMELEPGTYTLRILVDAREHGTHYAYAGRVHLGWEPGTSAGTCSWTEVKSLYR